MPWMEIVGVVGHVRNDGLDVDPRPQVYFNYRQRAQDRMALVVRGQQNVRLLTPAILQAVRDVDPEQPVMCSRASFQILTKFHCAVVGRARPCFCFSTICVTSAASFFAS